MLVVEEPGLQLFRFTGINCKLNLEHGFTVLERDLFLGHPIKLTSYPKIRTNKRFGGGGDRKHIVVKRLFSISYVLLPGETEHNKQS